MEQKLMEYVQPSLVNHGKKLMEHAYPKIVKHGKKYNLILQ